MAACAEDDDYETEKYENKMLAMYHSCMDKLELYWRCLGISKEETIDRANDVLVYMEDLMKAMVEEERISDEKAKNRVRKLSEEAERIALELNEVTEVPHPELPLLKKEQFLKEQLEFLQQEKQTRINHYKLLRETEHSMCLLLGMPMGEPLDHVPSKLKLKELEENVRMLENERRSRSNKFILVRNELTTIIEETEITPDTSFEMDLLCQDEDKVILSKDNLQNLMELVLKYQQRKKDLETEMQALKECLYVLWDRLDIDKAEREMFLTKFNGCSQSTVAAMKHEVERCEQIKRQNLQKYIHKLRLEFDDLWSKCYLSETEKQSFKSLLETSSNEELYDLLEKEVRNLKMWYEENKDILKKIAKRCVIWNSMMGFERKAEDPSRLQNRGGKLLKEERERKRIIKELSRLDEDIESAIEEYQKEKNVVFLVHGVTFQEYTTMQWEKLIQEKEVAKVERQKLRLIHGDAIRTPNKHPAFPSPTSAPSKLYGVSKNASNVRTPGFNSSRKPQQRKVTPVKNSAKKALWRDIQTPSQKVHGKRIVTTPYPQSKERCLSPLQFTDEQNTTEYNHSGISLLTPYSNRVKAKKVRGSKIKHSGTLRKSLKRKSQSSNYSTRVGSGQCDSLARSD